MENSWSITLHIYRQKQGEKGYFQDFTLDVNPDEYILDAIERVWAYHDRSLIFRHACHHSTCGACGMLVNNKEKLTCITPIHTVAKNGGVVKIQPLKNFPIVSDLAVDMSTFYIRMDTVHQAQVLPLDSAGLAYEVNPTSATQPVALERLSDCIECGLCVSACPSANTSSSYLGPGVLAGIHQTAVGQNDISCYELADNENGLWRCHTAFECSAACPSFVDPAWRIMDLRKKVIQAKVLSFLKPKVNEVSR